MICPSCRQEIANDIDICEKCGCKLKAVCPKCGTKNLIGTEKCSGCSLRLVFFCPECKAANNPKAKICRKCSAKLIAECPKCKTLCYITQKKCPACRYEFLKEPVKSQQEVSVKKNAPPFAVLAAEIINLSAIKSKIPDEELVNKLLAKFYQVLAKQAKFYSQSAKKISPQLMGIEFKNASNYQESAVAAVKASLDAMNEIAEFNHSINSKLNVKLKVKIGISLINKTDHDFSKTARLVSSAGSIVVNNLIYQTVRDFFVFEELSQNEQGSEKFYRLIDAVVKQEDRKNEDASSENLSKQAADQRVHSENGILETDLYNKDDALSLIVENIRNEDRKSFFTIAAPDGAGKSFLIMSARQMTEEEKNVWLFGICTSINQIVSLSLFQVALKMFFGLPVYNINIEDVKNSVINTLTDNFDISDPEIHKTILRIVLPEHNIEDEDIHLNKAKIFEALKIFFKKLSEKGKVVFVVEDIDFIDNYSFECLKYLFNSLDINLKVITTHQAGKSIETNLVSSGIARDNLTVINLKPMSEHQLRSIIDSLMDNQKVLPENLIKTICINSKGLPLYVEEALLFLMQKGTLYPQDDLIKFKSGDETVVIPEKIEELIKERLRILKETSPDEFKIMCYASLLGQVFMPVLLKQFVRCSDDEFDNILQSMMTKGIFTPIDNYNMIFRNRLIWESSYKNCIPEDLKTEYLSQVVNVLVNYTLSNGAVLARIAELIRKTRHAFEFWNLAAKEAVSLGDIHLYSIVSERMLALIDNIEEIDDKEKIKAEIYEKVGKLIYLTNHQEALKFLSNAVLFYEKQNIPVKVIEITGFMAKSCSVIGNNTGGIECVDRAIAQLKRESMPVEFALLKYARLEYLFNLGRLEEAVVSARNDVLPVLKDVLSKNANVKGLNSFQLNYVEMESEIFLAKSLAVQGSFECLNIAESVAQKARELDIEDIEIRARLIQAYFKTLQGELNASKAHLEYIKDKIEKTKLASNIIEWNFIDILNAYFSGDYQKIKDFAPQLAQYSQQVANYNVYTALKSLVSILFKNSGKFDIAEQILNELINYCSENKMATGALLSWYLISTLETIKSNTDNALSIAEKALDVANNANINNHYFKVLLYKQIAEIYTLKGDFKTAVMYIQKAVELTSKNGLKLLESELFLSYGKVFQEAATASDENKVQNLETAHRSYMKALNIAQELENEALIEQIEKELVSLATFCQLSGIKL